MAGLVRRFFNEKVTAINNDSTRISLKSSARQTTIKTFRIEQVNGDRKKVQVGKDQEKAQSERDSHSKNRGGKKPN